MIRRMLRDSAENPSDPSEAPLASSPPLNANYEVNLLSPFFSSSAAAAAAFRRFCASINYLDRPTDGRSAERASHVT